MNLKVKIKKLSTNAVLPSYAKPGDAGMDLTAIGVKETADYIEYQTGLALEIPEGYVGLIFPRSSNSNKDLLMCNSVAVIDSSYRGELLIRYKRIPNPVNHGVMNDHAVLFANSYRKKYELGERIAQLVILPYPKVEWEEEEELSLTERGEGGFGHSGL